MNREEQIAELQQENARLRKHRMELLDKAGQEFQTWKELELRQVRLERVVDAAREAVEKLPGVPAVYGLANALHAFDQQEKS
jgi:predicted nuclease with TOPRIM domain